MTFQAETTTKNEASFRRVPATKIDIENALCDLGVYDIENYVGFVGSILNAVLANDEYEHCVELAEVDGSIVCHLITDQEGENILKQYSRDLGFIVSEPTPISDSTTGAVNVTVYVKRVQSHATFTANTLEEAVAGKQALRPEPVMDKPAYTKADTSTTKETVADAVYSGQGIAPWKKWTAVGTLSAIVAGGIYWWLNRSE